MSQAARRTVDGRFGTERSEFAQAWVDAYEEWRVLRNPPTADPAGLVGRVVTRALAPRRERARCARLAAVEDEVLRAGDGLRWSLAGAPSGSWSVLSGVGAHRLEDTVNSIASDDGEAAGVRHAAKDIAAGIPAARAHAELGQHEHVRGLERQLLELIDSPGLSAPSRRRLTDHLPGNLRPLAASLEELDTSQSLTRLPVTLYVTLHGPDQRYHYAESPWIKLNDIVVTPEARGRGLGSASLAELCGYADHHGLPIQGELQPGPDAPDEAVTALAHWYNKRGFRQGDLHPDQWRRFGLIRREPVPADSTT